MSKSVLGARKKSKAFENAFEALEGRRRFEGVVALKASPRVEGVPKLRGAQGFKDAP
jgi:hypothetical protein